MKRTLLFALVLLPLFLGAHSAFAQVCATGSDNECPGDYVCNPDTKQCLAPSDPNYDTETSGIGDACSTQDDCRGSATICTGGKCQYDPAVPQASTPTSPSAGSSNNSAAPGASSANNFTALTQIPGITDITKSGSSISTFLNTLYKLCIGIAAILAVVQIIYAGLIWMSAGDSAEKVSKAKGLISSAIFGLILVLSPYIVFSIVNPGVLNLNFNFGNIKPSITGSSQTSTQTSATTPTTPAGSGTTGTPAPGTGATTGGTGATGGTATGGGTTPTPPPTGP